jgi:hypothetical protein
MSQSKEDASKIIYIGEARSKSQRVLALEVAEDITLEIARALNRDKPTLDEVEIYFKMGVDKVQVSFRAFDTTISVKDVLAAAIRKQYLAMGTHARIQSSETSKQLTRYNDTVNYLGMLVKYQQSRSG